MCSSRKLSVYWMATACLCWLAIGVVFLHISQSTMAAADTPLPTGVRRSLYPNEWGVGRPAGVAYSTRFDYLFLLDKIRPNSDIVTIVTITPYETLVDRIQLDFAAGSAINIAFDEQGQRLLLLDRRLTALAAITVDTQGRLNPATLRMVDLGGLRLRNIQGMAVDPRGQRLLLLDKVARQIVSLPLTPSLDIALDAVTWLDLTRLGTAALQGLAVHPATGHLFVGAPAQQLLYAVTQTGQVVNTYTTAALVLNDPQGFVFVPSADLTDDPTTFHLLVADSYLVDAQSAEMDPGASLDEQFLVNRNYLPFIALPVGAPASTMNTAQGATAVTGKGRLGELVEVALEWSPALVTAAVANAPIVLNLVQSVNTSAFAPPSPDPAGIAFIPTLNRLMISDSEVDEMPIFAGATLFETTLPGALIRTGSTLAYSREATDVAFDPANQHLFISDDDKRAVFELIMGPDGFYGTSDDLVTSFDTAIFNSLDPEGITYDADARALFIVDGVNTEVYRVSRGPNNRFDGVPAAGGDDIVTNFDVQGLGIYDPEGIHYDSVSKHLFLVGNNLTRLYEITTGGALVQLYDTSAAGIIKNAGITMAPGSNNPDVMNFYIVDRGVDNDVDPRENDGKLHELSLSANHPTPTPTLLLPTATNTPLPPTNTPTPIIPVTSTPLPPTATPNATAVTVCFAASQDTYLVQDAATKNTGSEADLKVKPDAGKERRILIAFNLAAVPQRSTVLSATLRLFEDTKKDGQTVYLHRLTNSWSELQATWNNRDSSTRWTNAGGDFENTVLATFMPNVDNRYRDIPVTGVTQNWVNDAVPNFGLLLRSTGVNGEVKFKSRSEANTAKRPQLCVTYQ